MRPALEVADVFRRHGAAYRADHAATLSNRQRRVMAAIEACRTPTLGGHVEQCDDCGDVRIAYNSCRDRHCPKCQGLARAQWLADRQSELLPVSYFHVVFTMPAPIAAMALQNKAVVYDILFRAAAETVRIIATDTRHLGAETGMIAVLHVYDTARARPVAVLLRPGKTPSGAEISRHLRRLVHRIRRHWPDTQLIIRGDGHYGRPEVMGWCEAKSVTYIFGLPRQQRAGWPG
jgi:hypothetical protein